MPAGQYSDRRDRSVWKLVGNEVQAQYRWPVKPCQSKKLSRPGKTGPTMKKGSNPVFWFWLLEGDLPLSTFAHTQL